jgi:hypothetical protein
MINRVLAAAVVAVVCGCAYAENMCGEPHLSVGGELPSQQQGLLKPGDNVAAAESIRLE